MKNTILLLLGFFIMIGCVKYTPAEVLSVRVSLGSLGNGVPCHNEYYTIKLTNGRIKELTSMFEPAWSTTRYNVGDTIQYPYMFLREIRK